MKIHEYQAKEILKEYGIPVQDGVVIESKDQAKEAINSVASQFNTSQFVIKAQIHAGGRGKGGGVKFSPTAEKAAENINNILGMQLITHQTGPEGQLVRKVMVAQAIDIAKEYYVAITLDRSTGQNVFMVSSEGGVEIEEVAEKHPEKIIKVWVDPSGMKPFQARQLAFALGLEGDVFKQAVKLFSLKGGQPANFLDVGGGANVETVKNGFKIILSDPNVKAVLINIFGGIVRCDRVANGIIQAVSELDLNVPVVVRLEGTNAEIARDLLANSGVDIIPAGSLEDAAEKVVAAATR
ncbi:hypothetical protein EBR96_05245 [bacterium]|nr:hypothetical protein [bacterium]